MNDKANKGCQCNACKETGNKRKHYTPDDLCYWCGEYGPGPTGYCPTCLEDKIMTSK